MAPEKIRVFYSYSHRDALWLPAIQNCLLGPRAWGWIDEWSDERLLAGEDWDEKIRAQMESADLILLLVSQNFLSAKGCREEVKLALKLAPAGILRRVLRSLANWTIHRDRRRTPPTIVPVILSGVTYQETKLGHLQPTPGWDLEIALPDPRPRLELTRTGLYGVLRQMNPKLMEPEAGETLVARRVQVPRLLPHLCDRVHQGRQVRRILGAPAEEGPKRTKPKRTMVVIARGPKDESHESFQVRLKLELVPAALGIPESELQREYLNWPEEDVSPKALRKSLAATAARLDRAGTSVLLDTMIYSSNWPGEQALAVFFQFWQDWKPLHANAFVVAQFFKFPAESKEDRALQSEGLLPYFALPPEPDDAEPGDRQPASSLLEPFEPVDLPDAEAWAHKAASFGVYDLLDVPRLQNTISGWYQTDGPKIPMGKLVTYFETLLPSSPAVDALAERHFR